MKNVKIKVMIDGDIYSEQQLRLIRFEREKHVLQEMIHLGAVITDHGKMVSYDDVNYLSYEDASRLVLDAKQQIGTTGIRELYKDSLERSAQMWRDIVRDYKKEDEMIRAVADIQVEGLTLEEFQKKLSFVLSGGDVSVMEEHPEHFQFTMMENADAKDKCGMETMGMYGGPTEVIVMPGGDEMQKKVISDEGFPSAACGTSRLVDGTPRYDIAHHQMRALENGFEVLTSVYFPCNTPKEMIEGHKLHLAMETFEMIEAAANVKDDRPEEHH